MPPPVMARLEDAAPAVAAAVSDAAETTSRARPNPRTFKLADRAANATVRAAANRIKAIADKRAATEAEADEPDNASQYSDAVSAKSDTGVVRRKVALATRKARKTRAIADGPADALVRPREPITTLAKISAASSRRAANAAEAAASNRGALVLARRAATADAEARTAARVAQLRNNGTMVVGEPPALTREPTQVAAADAALRDFLAQRRARIAADVAERTRGRNTQQLLANARLQPRLPTPAVNTKRNLVDALVNKQRAARELRRD